MGMAFVMICAHIYYTARQKRTKLKMIELWKSKPLPENHKICLVLICMNVNYQFKNFIKLICTLILIYEITSWFINNIFQNKILKLKLFEKKIINKIFKSFIPMNIKYLSWNFNFWNFFLIICISRKPTNIGHYCYTANNILILL